MKKTAVLTSLGIFLFLVGFVQEKEIPDIAILRRLYASGDVMQWPKANIDSTVAPNFEDIGALPPVSYPEYNPFSTEKAALGKMLFFDPRLSASKQIACASCHDPQLGWGDGKSLSHGHDRKVGKRNAMSLYNMGYFTSFFWDGRAKSLEEQVDFPLIDSVEMNNPLDIVVQHISEIAGYAPYFEAAFGDGTVNLERIQYAIATFERGIKSLPSRFDRFVKGDEKALSDQEIWGMHLFRTKARCINCHNTPLFSDNLFHNDGQALYGSRQEDLGHYHISGKQIDVGAFRTPSLRNITLTGPWMHHGNFPTLFDVVVYYNLGNPAPIQRHVQIDSTKVPIPSPLLRKLELSDDEVHAIISFLGAISSGVQARVNSPKLP
ncbi:cytochrome-c peroxidase [Sphingobacterium sp. DN00404]|uniref:Cytochrome-c peroxidase n=1 Tax=Sphingobacterium micropteri TaxID=2763501 RepID=A0ABR7YL54_9SPHI|nr:cytochrome c peroxidase [Sphingobacterium micropteri]MBD1431961.1 cytochrome-c peroxidase [Sphingobacterium micropteri]